MSVVHKRNLIRSSLRTLIENTLTTLNINVPVYLDRHFAAPMDKDPMWIEILPIRESNTYYIQSYQSYQRTYEIDVIIYVKSLNNGIVAADNLTDSVEWVIETYQGNLGVHEDFWDRISLTSTDMEVNHEGEVPITIMNMHYEIVYRTYASPEFPEFLRAEALYKIDGTVSDLINVPQ